MSDQPDESDESDGPGGRKGEDRQHGQTGPDGPDKPVEARVRPHRWVAWVWVVPMAAAGVVAWLTWQTLAERGPEITISFSAAQGLQPGQATIQHLNAVLGNVTSLQLTDDMRRVVVHARMTRKATPYLTDSTLFYLVTPHLGVQGISGLSTLVSGTYIEMYPGKPGKPQRHFPVVWRQDRIGRVHCAPRQFFGVCLVAAALAGSRRP